MILLLLCGLCWCFYTRSGMKHHLGYLSHQQKLLHPVSTASSHNTQRTLPNQHLKPHKVDRTANPPTISWKLKSPRGCLQVPSQDIGSNRKLGTSHNTTCFHSPSISVNCVKRDHECWLQNRRTVPEFRHYCKHSFMDINLQVPVNKIKPKSVQAFSNIRKRVEKATQTPWSKQDVANKQPQSSN